MSRKRLRPDRADYGVELAGFEHQGFCHSSVRGHKVERRKPRGGDFTALCVCRIQRGPVTELALRSRKIHFRRARAPQCELNKGPAEEPVGDVSKKSCALGPGTGLVSLVRSKSSYVRVLPRAGVSIPVFFKGTLVPSAGRGTPSY